MTREPRRTTSCIIGAPRLLQLLVRRLNHYSLCIESTGSVRQCLGWPLLELGGSMFVHYLPPVSSP